jgi:DNA-binding MarR family transcriptional regulator
VKESSDPVASELLSAIGLVHRTARRSARHAWPAEPLPPAQGELLRLAASRPGITVADAAQELRLAPNTVSTLVGKLTSAGLLARSRGPQDARVAMLTVTDAARRRLAQWRDLRADLTAQALARLSAADRRTLDAALPALLRLAEGMESRDRAA